MSGYCASHSRFYWGLKLDLFSGKDFKKITESMALRLLRPDRKDETYRNGNLGRVRQWIESVNQTLKGQLGLEQHGGRTPAGVFTRIAQRLLRASATTGTPA